MNITPEQVAAMHVGDELPIPGSEWETPQRDDFEVAVQYAAAHRPKQFEVVTGWRPSNVRGINERSFTLKRIR